MTLEQLQNSDVVKQWLSTLLSHKTFADILDTVQQMAMPTKQKVEAPMIPGLHPDTALAHQAHFYAGWSECINFIRSIPQGARMPAGEPEEEPFAHLPEIKEIDKAIEIARNQQAP